VLQKSKGGRGDKSSLRKFITSLSRLIKMTNDNSEPKRSETNITFQQYLLLSPFQRKLLQKTLQQDDLSEKYRQRIQIMLLADEGKTQTQICKQLGCSMVTARHWTMIAQSGQAHNWSNFPIGRPKLVNDEYLDRLEEIVNHSPRDYGYSFRLWTVNWLRKHLAKELGVEVSDRHLKRLLKQMGLSTRSQTSNVSENKTDEANSCKILIGDLKYQDISDSAEFVPID